MDRALETPTPTVDILAVDDVAENRMSMQALLDAPDRNVVTAASAEDALAVLDDLDPALILLDVHLPGMSGFELAERLRSEERTRKIPIIFVTAIKQEARHVFEGYEAGAVDYLFRPIDPHVLRSKASIFCEIWRQRRTIEEKNAALERHIAEIDRLRGLIPICCNCKKVRQDDGYWKQVEVYVMERSAVQFSHGICEDCAEELYPDPAKEPRP